MTDVNGEVPFTFEHNAGAWNAVAVDSVGRNVVITNPLSGVWTPPTTSNPPGYEITVGISALNTVTMPNILRLNGTATDNLGNTLTATWSQVSGPGTITFTPTQQQVTNGPVVANASFSDAGNYVVQLTATYPSGNSCSDAVHGNCNAPDRSGPARMDHQSHLRSNRLWLGSHRLHAGSESPKMGFCVPYYPASKNGSISNVTVLMLTPSERARLARSMQPRWPMARTGFSFREPTQTATAFTASSLSPYLAAINRAV